MNDGKVQGKRVLVTGGTNGIGLAGARRLVDEGAPVAETGAALDGLWLNAGYSDIAGVDEITTEFFDRMMAVNVRAVFLQIAALDNI